jgi:hypothetical protein
MATSNVKNKLRHTLVFMFWDRIYALPPPSPRVLRDSQPGWAGQSSLCSRVRNTSYIRLYPASVLKTFVDGLISILKTLLSLLRCVMMISECHRPTCPQIHLRSLASSVWHCRRFQRNQKFCIRLDVRPQRRITCNFQDFKTLDGYKHTNSRKQGRNGGNLSVSLFSHTVLFQYYNSLVDTAKIRTIPFTCWEERNLYWTVSIRAEITPYGLSL